MTTAEFQAAATDATPLYDFTPPPAPPVDAPFLRQIEEPVPLVGGMRRGIWEVIRIFAADAGGAKIGLYRQDHRARHPDPRPGASRLISPQEAAGLLCKWGTVEDVPAEIEPGFAGLEV